MNTFFKTLWSLVIFLLSTGMLLAAPWDSCDERWRKAWAKHPDRCPTQLASSIKEWGGRMDEPVCLETLPAKLKPDCEPDNEYLKSYRDGSDGYRRQLKEIEIRSEYREWRDSIKYAIFEAYDYYVSYDYSLASASDYHGSSPVLDFSARIANAHPNRKIKSVSATCKVDANGSVRLYFGQVRFNTNLLPGRSAYFRAEFIRPTATANRVPVLGNRGLYPSYYDDSEYSPEPEKHYAISTRDQPINSLKIECAATQVDMEF